MAGLNGREVWLKIDEAPKYSVSSWGRVRNDNTGLILKGGDSNGYRTLVLMGNNGERLTRTIHRLVAMAFYDGWTPDLEVNHYDTNKANNFVGNLEWVTHAQNQAHASRTGRMRNSGRAKTPIRIVETGVVYPSQSECARAIGGHSGAISSVLFGRSSHHKGYTFEYVE